MASIIKTDNIQKVSDDSNIIKKCGSTTTVGSGAGNTITVDGATITLGRCGGTVSLASGATQTGFGQTYTAVDFCTTAKTSPFTAVSGKGYFVNTTSGGVTVTLPSSPSAGDIVAIKDYANTFNSNNVTLCRNGSKISGGCVNAVVATQGQSISMVYVDGTRGWLNIQTDSTVEAPAFITASGGTITTSGNYKIHTFTGDGTFTATAGTSAPNNEVSYLVVAGGGGSGSQQRGGGGAGGFREDKASNDSYSASPLDGAGTINITTGTFPITVGAGGAAGTAASPDANTNGANSVFSSITSTGGGSGGSGTAQPGGPYPGGGPGGSGGGAGENQPNPGSNGNQPPVSPAQGNPGGNGCRGGPNAGSAAGGGGAGGAGGPIQGTSPDSKGGAGGVGVSTSISGSPLSYAGGGGGGGYPTAGISGGPGSPCGTGGAGGTHPGGDGGNGTTNRGGGGGSGAGNGGDGGTGGSGVVIIRYKFQN
jgi:hypothetical protein